MKMVEKDEERLVAGKIAPADFMGWLTAQIKLVIDTIEDTHLISLTLPFSVVNSFDKPAHIRAGQSDMMKLGP